MPEGRTPVGKRQPFLAGRLAVLLLLLMLAVAAPPALAGPGGDSTPPRDSSSHWVLTFHDEFDGKKLDTKKWTASEGMFPNRSQWIQYFLPRNVKVENGSLRLRAKREEYRSPHNRLKYSFTSGEVRTIGKFSQRYGRYEVRCRFPLTRGTWPATYLLPDDDSWPPEIDITEFIGRDPHEVYLTQHWKDAHGSHEQANFNYRDHDTDWSDWHIYVLEWEPDAIRWYIDGRLCGESNYAIPDVPMYLRVNLAVGGGFAGRPAPGPWPQDYDIDYIRVYRRPDQSAPASPSRESIAALRHSARVARSWEDPLASSRGWIWDHLGWLLLFGGLPLTWLVTAFHRDSDKKRAERTRTLALYTGLTGVNYLLWRIGVIHEANLWIAIPFFAAEVFGIAHVVGFMYTVWPRPQPVITPTEDPTQHPVFIFIPTVNEGAAVLEPTIRGALAAKERYLAEHPHAAPVRIVVCNDGRVAGVSDYEAVEALAARRGVECITRETPGGAKAGNIEHARQVVGATGAPLIAVFDADMAAEPEFLVKTVTPFADPTIGWVQTGQYYRNRENPVARWADDQQALFYRVICPGKARLNANFLCGTNFVIRASALDEIDGLPQDSITEDFAASVPLHARGWRSLYLPDVLATGLGPVDLPSYFAQQRRWATGVFEVLRRQASLILRFGRRRSGTDGLTGAQRIQYLLSCTHYLSGVCNLVFLLVPLVYLIMGVAAVRPAAPDLLMGYLLPFWIFSLLAFAYVAGGRLHLRGVVLGFGSFPVLIHSLLTVVRGRRIGFEVTRKVRRRELRSLPPLRLHAAALLLCAAALWRSPDAPGSTLFNVVSVFWVLYMAVMLLAIVRLGFAGSSAEVAPQSVDLPTLTSTNTAEPCSWR